MTSSFHIHIATAEAMMRHYDPQRVHGYCASCPQHGLFWSCPPFAKPPLSAFSEWDHAVLVFKKVWTKPGSSKDQMIERFHEARRAFRAFLLEAEALNPEVTALVAGYCQACEECPRLAGSPCRVPAALRYSLEAVGFDVTGLTEELAGQKLLWPTDGLPEYLLTVGALLCAGRDRSERLGQAMMNRDKELQHG